MHMSAGYAGRMRKIHVIHENDTWVEPLRAAFDELSLPYAERILGAAGIKVGDVDTVRAAPEPGVVMAVRPPPGNGQPRGSSVDLLVSGGEGGGS